MTDAATPNLSDTLAPLLPQGASLGDSLDDAALAPLASAWQQLAELGFEVGVSADELRVQQRDRGFEIVIQLSRPDDLGELRSLFLALRQHFGRLRDRWMPWLFLPGPAVTAPYDHLRTVVGTCQRLRQKR